MEILLLLCVFKACHVLQKNMKDGQYCSEYNKNNIIHGEDGELSLTSPVYLHLYN